MSGDPAVRAAAEAWLAADPDPHTRAELETLLASAGTDAGAAEELRGASTGGCGSAPPACGRRWGRARRE